MSNLAFTALKAEIPRQRVANLPQLVPLGGYVQDYLKHLLSTGYDSLRGVFNQPPRLIPLAFEVAGEIERLLPTCVCVGMNQVILMLVSLRCWCVHTLNLQIFAVLAKAMHQSMEVSCQTL